MILSAFLPGSPFSSIFGNDAPLHPFDGTEFVILILAG
jgi:hypothetical protein